jgi:hypothetical protein
MSEETERPNGTEIPEDARLPEGVEVILVGQDPWQEGEPLPHTAQDFSDAPRGRSAEDWKRVLAGAARAADDAEELAVVLLCSVGVDLVRVHAVPPDVAEDGVTKWAEWLFAEFHGTPDPDVARAE